jgi:hypothetical protein
MSPRASSGYRPTESKFKGGAKDMFVTYELDQRTRGGGHALMARVKRVYIAGDVTDWKTGVFRKRSGREARGVKIEYEQQRGGYDRREFEASRGDTHYRVGPAHVAPTVQRFTQIVDVPDRAQKVRFYPDLRSMPAEYQSALQNVR